MRILIGSIIAAVVALASSAHAQPIDTVLISEVGRFQFPYWAFPSGSSYYTVSSRIDRLDRPYLFMACMEHGLVTLDLSDPATPVPVDTLWPADLGGLKATNLEQVNDLLYVSLGGFEGTAEMAGLAIVDVSDPAQPTVLDVWADPAFMNGTAIVKVDGNNAYLGAMEDGLIVLDVSDPSDIQFISSFQPDPDWPGIAGYPPNGRGMAIVGDVLFLAYDAGGLRALDISDPFAVSQIGQYVNPSIPPLTPPAYNNLVVIEGVAFVTIDFCGLEVIDVSDPAAMTQINWLNPWNCIGLSWFGSDGHTNEVMATMGDSLLFVSGADSEILVYDITAPGNPQLKGGHILPNDTAATWGVDVHGSLVVGNFINNQNLPLQPYYSGYGGVVLFDWVAEFSTGVPTSGVAQDELLARPNPTSGLIEVMNVRRNARLRISDSFGRLVREDRPMNRSVVLDLRGIAPGTFSITEITDGGSRTSRVLLLPE
ncbi:MAG: hypothetical protein IPM46_07340 [Flavobacteriales bacterium]|nr:hypothetical protein [Flavobacteriales bacterium]